MSTQKLSILYYYTIQQNERIQPVAKPTTLPLHSLTVSLTQSRRMFYNVTIQYTTILQCFPFIRELPWENNTGHPISWAHKLLDNKHPKKYHSRASPPNPRKGTMSPCWDECTVTLGYKHGQTITSMNLEDHAPQPTILQQFHLVIKYNKGIHNRVAYMLSRPATNASIILQNNSLAYESYI